MTLALLIVLFFGQIALIGWGLLRKGRIYEFPFLASAVFLGFIFLQLVGLYNTDYELPEGALDHLIVMTMLCLATIYFGNQQSKKPLETFDWDYNEQKLLYGSVFLTLLGAFFFFKISRLPVELQNQSQWSGVTVAYHFFATTLSYGFALATLVYFRTGRWLALLILGLGAMFYLDRILFAGRRGDASEFFFIVVLAIWFGKKRILPKSIMLIIMAAMTLGLHSTGDYRSKVRDGNDSPLSAIENIDFIGNIKNILDGGGTELKSAVYKIATVEKTGHYDFGLFHWNMLVFNYVPAQLVGADIKKSLTIPIDVSASESIFGYEKPTGATSTGLSDSFVSFWFFGGIKFYLIAFILKKIYLKAQLGGVSAQLFYMIMMGNALHAITHETHWFLSPWVHMAIFLFPVLWYARNGSRSIKFSGFNC